MKKQLIILYYLGISIHSFGQNIFPANGNVGIGTNSPGSKLSIISGSGSATFLNGSAGLGNLFNFHGVNGANLSFSMYTPSTGDLKTRIGINYAINGDNGFTDYTITGIKKSPFIEFNAENGSVSLYGENGSGSDWRTPTLNLGLHVAGNGNVGIGITNPAGKLSFTNVNESDDPLGITWYNASGDPTLYGIHRTSGTWTAPDYQQLRLGWHTGIVLDPGTVYGKSYVDVQGGGLRVTSGNVGIGTLSPSAKLHSLGTVRFEGLANDNAAPHILATDVNGNVSWRDATTLGGSGGTSNWITSGTNIYNLNTGSVTIGTNVLPAADAKLAVKGNIYAQKIKVTQNGWADYVFDKSYKLRPLTEVEKFIKQNHHLPEVPSAVEVEKNGLDLGDNQATLLKKIEELTLYLIEQNKKLEEQNRKMEQQQQQINRLIKKDLSNRKRRSVK